MKLTDLPFIKALGQNGSFIPKLRSDELQLFEDGTIGALLIKHITGVVNDKIAVERKNYKLSNKSLISSFGMITENHEDLSDSDSF